MDRITNLRRTFAICAILSALTFAAFWPVLRHEFVNYDDPDYVTENPHVLGGLNARNVSWAFRTPHAGNWHPLTWLSHMLDVSVFSLQPGGHHLTSLMLHAANAVLLFLLLQRMLRAAWTSAFIAGVFALHPVHVESVAWVAERKDVLSGLFFMLTLLAYERYARCGQYSVSSVQFSEGAKTRAGNGRRLAFYILALVAFAFGLMSKPMLVTLPFVLLLLDYWPLKRIALPARSRGEAPSENTRILLEKIPFFLLTILSSVITFVVQRSAGAMTSVETLPIGFRISNALVAYFRYLGKTLWPADLAVFYPLPKEWPFEFVAVAAGVILVISVLAVRFAIKAPYFPVGWFWFLGTLVPVIGLLQVGQQSMADRYMYLPLIGLALAIAWGAREIATRWPSAELPSSLVGIAVIAACMITTWFQVSSWANTTTLFEHALVVTRDNAVAHNNLGTVYLNQKQKQRAEEHFAEAVRIKPNYPEALVNLALCREEDKKPQEARELFERSLAIQETATAHYNLANLLSSGGELQAAESHYLSALRMKPEMAEAIYNLGAVEAKQGKVEEALKNYNAALKLKPDLKDVHLNAGALLASQKRWDEAIAEFEAAIKSEPENADARFNLAAALEAKGDLHGAAAQFGEVVRLRADDAESLEHLGLLQLSQGFAAEAIPHLEALVRLRPKAQTQYYLALALDAVGRAKEAVTHYREAVRLQPKAPLYLNDLAWILATCPNDEIRNGAEAVQLAQQACEIAGDKEPRFWGTLDAAYASASRFDDAIKTAAKTQALAKAANQAEIAQAAEQRLALYKAGKPYRSGLDVPARH